VEQEPLPAVTGNKVKLQMIAAPINPADFNIIQGNYGVKVPLPAVGGLEGVGIVTEAGPAASLRPGDWAIAAGNEEFGTWRTHGVVSEDALLRVPNDLAPEHAACLGVNPSTALRLLKDFAALQPGDTIIQNGANSMVGMCVIQLAKHHGIRTINVLRKRPGHDATVEQLKALGGDLVINEELVRQPQLQALVNELGRPKLALNCISGESAHTIATTLADGGTLVTYGAMSHKPLQIPSGQLIFRDITYRGFWLHRWAQQHSRAERQAVVDELVGLVKQKRLGLWVERHAFSDLPHALTRAAEPFRDRKVVMMMEK